MDTYPLRFTPILKQTIWGGRRLATQLGKVLGEEDNYAESWEIVDHGEDQSVVENGPLAGKTLEELVADKNIGVLGHYTSSESFPLLLKYLDCNRVLSVQVHPDDEYGRKMSPPDLGKTEAWYIVESQEDSLVYAGLKTGVTRRDLQVAAEQGETDSVLHAFHPEAGDVLYIPAGTVHALGEGLLVAEIQQSSNTTFRLHDWNRVDAQGQSRQLHIAESLEVTDFTRGPISPLRAQDHQPHWQEIIRCDKFVLNILNSGSDVIAGDGYFHILTVPKGCAKLQTQGGEYPLNAGESILLPASMTQVTVITSPETVVLEMHQPI